MFLTHEKYLKLCDELSGNYWKEGYKYRWQYMDYVIAQAIIIGGQKIIEAGASGMPLFKDSFLFDYPATVTHLDGRRDDKVRRVKKGRR